MRGRTMHVTWRHDPTLYAPPRYRRACGYDVFVPDQLPEDEDWSLPGEVAGIVAEAEQAIGDLNREASPELASLQRLLLRTESIASSKVEGMQADARALARAEARRSYGRSIGREASEILANIAAMIHAVDDAVQATSLTTAGIQDIHRVLLAHWSTERIAGVIRTQQNWIGGNDYNPCGADYVPPPAEEVERLLRDLCEFSNAETLPPLVQAALAHAQFETIHPFDDGNGRTGRALAQVILRRRGLAPRFVPPISVVLSRRRDRYIEGLTKFRDDRLAEWIEFFAASASEAARLALHYRSLVADLQEFWRERLRAEVRPRGDATAWALINALPAFPAVTVEAAATATGRTPPAVGNAIAQLEQARVLTPLTESKRYRVWEPVGLLDLIIALEAGE